MYDPVFVSGLMGRMQDLESRIAAIQDRLQAEMTQAAPIAPDVVPDEVTQHLAAGIHPVRAVRTFRMMTQKELSERSGVGENHISSIECGAEFGLRTARRLAEALQVPVSVLK